MSGEKILIIDLDFEAPGQHKSGLFSTNPIADSNIKGGLLDLFDSWKKHSSENNEKVYDWDLQDYILRSPYLDSWTGTKKGEVFLMPAGKLLNKQYADKLNRFNWHEFFLPKPNGFEGYKLLADIKLYCGIEGFEFVFIDSRTGLSDPYYMATSWLSDTVVCFSLLNKQSIEGCRYAMEFTQTESFKQKYGEKRILPVLTLIPPTRDTETTSRIQEILQYEWPEIQERFVTTFRYDEALSLEEKVLPTTSGFRESSFGHSLVELDSALNDRSSFLVGSDEIRRKFGQPIKQNPFPNLRVEFWQPKDIASHYSAIYPSIEEQLTSFQPAIIYGSRGTGKTTMARYFDHETQLIVFHKHYGRTPDPKDISYLGLWLRLESDTLKAFNIPDDEKKKNYNTLFGLLFDMEVLIKALSALNSFGGLEKWFESPSKLFEILCREIGVSWEEGNKLRTFLDHLETRLADIRAYINNPNRVEMPYQFQGNILMKLVVDRLVERDSFHFVVFIDEVENFACYQQKMLNTRLKHAKVSDSVTYKLLVRNGGIKTNLIDGSEQQLEVTHDYRDFYLDEEIGFNEFKDRAEKLVDRYISVSPQFKHIGKVNGFLERVAPEAEAKIICDKLHNKKLIAYLEKKYSKDTTVKLIEWMQKESSLLRQAVAVIMVNQGKSADDVALQMAKNSSKAQDWYHNYSRGAIYWLCTLHHKTKIYSGFNDIVGISGENIRVLIDLFYSIFDKWMKSEDSKLPFNYELQNQCIHALSKDYFKNLERFRPTENQLNRLVERIGNLFEAIHKSPRQGEPEINHFSVKGKLDDPTFEYLKICRQENLLQWLSSNKQKSSSDYLPDAFRLNPCFAPKFGISWRRKKKLHLLPDQVKILCSGDDASWKKVHSQINGQYSRCNDKNDVSQLTIPNIDKNN